MDPRDPYAPMPVRSWVLPGDTADVATVARIKDDLRAWRLGRCIFVGDAGMYSADNMAALSRGLGRHILAVPMRKVKEIELEVLTRPGRYKPVADNLQVKEVVVGEGERRRRYVLCLNPDEAERQRLHREQVLSELAAELSLLREREADHPKAACTLLTSRRYGRYLTPDYLGRPRLDAAKVKAAAKFDGKFVVITNDDTLTAEDVALGYKGGWLIDIDQAWRLSRIKGCVVSLDDRLRQAAPWRRRCPDGLQAGDRGGVGGDQLGQAGAGFDCAAEQASVLHPVIERWLRYAKFFGQFADRPFIRLSLRNRPRPALPGFDDTGRGQKPAHHRGVEGVAPFRRSPGFPVEDGCDVGAAVPHPV
jgi:hypothetical protein